MCFSDGIFDTKRVTKRAFDDKGKSKIPNYTWHHHQDTGRMQLIREGLHHDTGHIGWEAMNKGR
ncbi:MAG: HNH endonuclease [Neisseria sp.]|nr:HNH endonuclease [Neisseria sp.]